jgi:hypothetical protein
MRTDDLARWKYRWKAIKFLMDIILSMLPMKMGMIISHKYFGKEVTFLRNSNAGKPESKVNRTIAANYMSSLRTQP